MRHINLIMPNDLLISYIVFKWQRLENMKWIVNLIDRIDRINESCQTYQVKLSWKMALQCSKNSETGEQPVYLKLWVTNIS